MKDLWRPLSVVGVLLALLVYLLLGSLSPDLSLRNDMREQVQTFALRDAELTRDVLLARAGLLPNYDALQRDRAGLFATLASLRQTGTPAPLLAPPTDALAHALERRLTDIERFKANDALLRNSVTYLTYTLSRPDLGTGARAALSPDVGELSSAFLRFVQSPAGGTGADFKAALDRLERRVGSDDDLRSIVTHGTLVARLLPQLVDVVGQIVQAPTTAALGTLQAAVERVGTDAEVRAQRFRFALFAVALVLLAYLNAQFMRLRGYARRMRDTNAELNRQIQERRTLEDTARQQEAKLAQANKMAALGTLVSGVAHEINNPNQMVLLNASVLADTWRDACRVLDEHREREGAFTLAGLPYDEMRDAAATLIRDLDDGARRIDRIVQDLKDFARPGQGGQQADVDLNAVVQRAVRMLAHLVKKRTQHFNVALAPALPVVRGDPQQIEQVVVNLVVNALEALPDATCSVSVATRTDDAGSVVLEVQDQGCGIPADHIERLCDPFFTTKQDSGGTGLGLSVTFSLVRAHGGRLTFDSEPGRGTRAVVQLPGASQPPLTSPIPF